jgi:DNA-binding MarR family transcriptional regulator
VKRKKIRRVPAPDFKRALEAAKTAAVFQQLFKCARLINEAALARVRAESGRRVRPAHTALFPHIDLDGTRLTELASRLGVTKQAVGQLVQDLEAMDLLERVPDPHDGRAWLVRFSAQGRRAMMHGLGVLKTLEDDLRVAIGGPAMEALARGLGALLAHLERKEREKDSHPA